MKPILFLFFMIPFVAYSQKAPEVAWKRLYGGKKSETAHDVISTYVGQILVAGETNSPPAKNQDGLIVFLDAKGDTVFQKTYGGEGDDIFKAAVQTYDGNFVLAGYTTSIGNGQSDAWLLKINSRGDTLWQKTIGSKGEDQFADIIQTSDGRLVAVGFTSANGRKDTWVYTMYDDGELLWQQTYGNRGADQAVAVAEGMDGNYGVTGTTSSGAGKLNVWLFILSREGKPLHHQIFGSRQLDEVNGLAATTDGGYALAGYTKTDGRNKGAGLKDMWVIKTDASAREMWQRLYGGASNDSALDITETPGGDLLVAGYTYSHLMGANTPESMLLKVSGRDGRLIWEQSPPFGGSGVDELSAVVVMSDGSFVLAGQTDSKQEGAKSQDLWVFRLAPEYVPTTTLPTELTVKDLQVIGIKNNALTETDDAFVVFTLENTGTQDAYDIDLGVLDKAGVPGLTYPQLVKAGFLGRGRSKKITLPLRAKNISKVATARLEIHYSDASRSRGKSNEVSLTVRPATIPSNFLQVEWVNPSREEFPSGIKPVKMEKVSIKVLARSDKPLKSGNFTVLVNGQPYKAGQKAGEAGLRARNNERDSSGMYLYNYTNLLTLGVGVSTLEVIVENDGKKESTGTFNVQFNDLPNLHIIALGVEHSDLLFTTKDAQDFASGFTNQDGKIFDKVYVRALVGGDSVSGVAQTDGLIIKQAFADLKEKYNYTIYPRDFMVLFISSHGKNVGNTFKILPSDYQMTPDKEWVDFQNDIVEQVDKIACNKIIFIDACQSGTIGVAAGTDNAAQTAKTIVAVGSAATGTNTLASCNAEESSWEDKSWGNGAFTRAILSAFKNEPYKDAAGSFQPTTDDDILTLGELYAYIARRVPQMIADAGKQGTQHPFIIPAQLDKVKDVPFFKVQ